MVQPYSQDLRRKAVIRGRSYHRLLRGAFFPFLSPAHSTLIWFSLRDSVSVTLSFCSSCQPTSSHACAAPGAWQVSVMDDYFVRLRLAYLSIYKGLSPHMLFTFCLSSVRLPDPTLSLRHYLHLFRSEKETRHTYLVLSEAVNLSISLSFSRFDVSTA